MKRRAVKVTRGRAMKNKEATAEAGEPRQQCGIAEEEEQIIPVVREEVSVGRRAVETGRVQVRKTVEEQTRTIDEPLAQEQVTVRRVTVNRPVDQPPPVRQEGQTTIIPVVKEELVVVKRLVLVEEVHVERVRSMVREPKDVVVRSERAEVQRIPGAHAGEATAKSARK